ncbi:Hypothetical predicted protein [Cloeon dipterum]|uniref:Uncharacterized protein n=1 Tax=Cloeon dipterum TaxID=197152 RepID=A0A8S1E0Y4_9INSE|nr:Hypothetical predicted protein [Cloeon dipterum]
MSSSTDFRSYEERMCTQFALLYPLRAGLFGVKSGSSTSLPAPNKLEPRPVAMRERAHQLCRRRGSSMSELDKVQIQQLERGRLDERRDAQQQRTSGYDTAPHSPALHRRAFLDSADNVRGSIGDLMNLKQYGSVWSVRSATESIAHAVPLATVTPRRMAEPTSEEPPRHEPAAAAAAAATPVALKKPVPLPRSVSPAPPEMLQVARASKMMTTVQRTERLSRLIRDTNSDSVKRKTVSSLQPAWWA